MSNSSLLWTPTPHGTFETSSLENSTGYRALLRHLGYDADKLDALAAELTKAAQKKRLSRFDILLKGNKPVEELSREYEAILEETLGKNGKIQWRVIPANVVRGEAQSRLAALLSPIEPQVWLRLYVNL